MVHYSCVNDCYNKSTMEGLSWHGYPEDKKLVKVNMCYLNVRSYKTFVLWICNLISFLHRDGSLDSVSPNANKRYLRAGACPSILSWTKQTPKR